MSALIRGMKRLALLTVIAVIGLAVKAGNSAAAEFVQAKRDADFSKSARRQDSELLKFYGNQVPAGTEFSHLGSFRALVHRNGLERSITLVPPRALMYENAEELRKAARAKDVVVGAIKLTYGSVDPEIVPGTILLVYDGLRVHLHDTHSQNVAQYQVSLGEVPADAVVDSELGKLDETNHSLANILPDGTMQVYLQLSNSKGDPIMDGQKYRKILLQFTIPGIVTDDDSPKIELVPPKPKEKGDKPSGGGDDDSSSSGGGSSYHHH